MSFRARCLAVLGMLRHQLKVLFCRLKMFHLQLRMFYFHRKMLRFHDEVIRFHKQAPDRICANAPLPGITTSSTRVVSLTERGATERLANQHPAVQREITHA